MSMPLAADTVWRAVGFGNAKEDHVMYVEMMNVQSTILDEIADKRMTRDDVAVTYAFALRSREAAKGGVDWGTINRAIMDRWSLSALKYIKEKAWKMAEGRNG